MARQLILKSKESGINCHYHFVDFKSAFNTIWRKALLLISLKKCMKKQHLQLLQMDSLQSGSLLVSVSNKVVYFLHLFSKNCLQEYVTLDYN